MVFILSTQKEISTDNTVEWLIGRNVKIIRINKEDPENSVYIELTKNGAHSLHIFNKHSKVSLQDVNAVWFRRGKISSCFYNLPMETSWHVTNHLYEETKTVVDFMSNILSDKKSLNHPDCYNMNKLIALQNAVKAGFEIPDTLVAQSYNKLNTFKTKYKKVISKPIQDCIMVKGEMYGHICTVSDKFDKKFGLSLFQEEIPKRVELRVFYLNGKCFTAAVFPNNEKTIDGRILERKDEKLKRIVPFLLPEKQQDKIRKFMELSNLNCGSLDIILTPNNRYVFLEVNPVGQFDYVSKICNYYLEREIANYLAEPAN